MTFEINKYVDLCRQQMNRHKSNGDRITLSNSLYQQLDTLVTIYRRIQKCQFPEFDKLELKMLEYMCSAPTCIYDHHVVDHVLQPDSCDEFIEQIRGIIDDTSSRDARLYIAINMIFLEALQSNGMEYFTDHIIQRKDIKIKLVENYMELFDEHLKKEITH